MIPFLHLVAQKIGNKDIRIASAGLLLAEYKEKAYAEIYHDLWFAFHSRY